MANNFSADSNCVAVWNFETGAAFVADTGPVGTNTLTNANTVAEDDDAKQGSKSALFSVNKRFIITDANLNSTFPIKNGVSTGKISVCFWAKPHANTVGIIRKGTTGGSDATFSIVYTVGRFFRMTIGYNSGASGESLSFGTAATLDQWFHVGMTFDDSDKSWRIRVWDDTAGSLLAVDATGTATNNINIEAADFVIGAGDGANYYEGRLDEVVVFKDILTADEIDKIRAGTYGASSSTGKLMMFTRGVLLGMASGMPFGSAGMIK